MRLTIFSRRLMATDSDIHWRLVRWSGRWLAQACIAVKGSDGLTHLALAMQFTNSWNLPATIQSVEVVDPSRNNKTTGRDRVISVKDEDVTGLVKLSSLPPSMDKASYSSKIAGGETGVMFFDVTYGDDNDVPCTIALRVHVVQPENKHLPESTVVSPPLKISSRAAIVLAPPFKGEGWVDANGCCVEIGQSHERDA
jgi:hypothetical protein